MQVAGEQTCYVLEIITNRQCWRVQAAWRRRCTCTRPVQGSIQGRLREGSLESEWEQRVVSIFRSQVGASCCPYPHGWISAGPWRVWQGHWRLSGRCAAHGSVSGISESTHVYVHCPLHGEHHLLCPGGSVSPAGWRACSAMHRLWW